VTLLFSDIEGSTRLLQKLGSAYERLLATHHALVRSAVEQHSGRVVDTAGDGFFLVFPTARDAVLAAVLAQRRLFETEWPEDTQVRVRMGMHTGEPVLGGTGYIGLDVHRAARICAAANGGQVLLSASTRDLVAAEMPPGVAVRALGPHRLKDLHEPEHLHQLDIFGLDTEFPPIGGATPRLNNFAGPPTLLIGRDAAVAEIRGQVTRPEVRALTLTGPGGTGKTRLALAVAVATAESFDNGAWFVPLASIRKASLVGPTIARALGITERPHTSVIECLGAALSSRATLLVLDNFEQVTDAAPLVAELLAACPGLTVLATSRGILRIRGEHEYPVTPLPLPERRRWHDVTVLSDSPAVALFVERARAVRPDFELTRDNAPAVAEICSRLDGLPLALELAAARIRLFSPEALLNRLGRRLDLLKGGARDLPERHRALRQTIAWSHDLLAEPEQRLFRRIAVFNGGFSLEAAERVAETAGDLGVDVLDGIIALVDRGLIRRDEAGDGGVRFALLETIRDFALEQLELSGESTSTSHAHADCFLDLAETAAAQLAGAEAVAWLDRLERDHDNLRATLTWAEGAGEATLAHRMAAALWRFWIIRGHMREGRERLQQVHDMGGDPSVARARMLHAFGTLTHELSDFEGARSLLEEELEVWRALRDTSGIAQATTGLGWVASMHGDFRTGLRQSTEALELYRALGDESGITLALHQIGLVHLFEGHVRLAIAVTEEVLVRRARAGDRRAHAFTQTNLASMLAQSGDYDRAGALLDEAFVTLSMLRDRQVSAWNLNQQALLAWARGDAARAAASLDESLEWWREVGNDFGLAHALTLYSTISLDLGRHEEAARYLDRAAAAWSAMGSRSTEFMLACPAARLALQQGDSGTAAKRLLVCIENFERTGNALDGPEALEIFAAIRKDRDDSAGATLFLAAAADYRDREATPVPACRRDFVDSIVRWCQEQGQDIGSLRGKPDLFEQATAVARRTVAGAVDPT
jgi:predicted ATPase/class 3 adenylate cyclase